MKDPRARLNEALNVRDQAIAELRTALANEQSLRLSLRYELDAERAAREALAARLEHGLIDVDRRDAELSRRVAEVAGGLAAEMGAREALAGELGQVDRSVTGPRLARLEMAVRRMEQSGVGGPASNGFRATPTENSGRESADPGLDPRLYMAIEDKFRGSNDLIAERQLPYARRLAETLGEGARVLDIGCGRGEFLSLLRSEGLSPIGVDTNVAAIDEVLSQDLEGVCADAADYLREQEDCSLAGAVMFHIVEHMPVSALASLLELLSHKIAPGGLLCIETPNPENLRVGAHTFWLDPTHVRPVPPILLELLVGYHGFDVVESLRLHPYPELPQDPSHVELALLGPQDFGLIARLRN